MNDNTEKKRKSNGRLEESDELDRKRKLGSLRSAEADLKVIVGQEEENREVFWHIRQNLASQSGYVDLLLSTRLPTNNDSNPSDDHTEIVFSDIAPSQWKRMIRFLNDPYSMTPDDAFELVSLYDKYDFKSGIKICDGILLEKVFLVDWDKRNLRKYFCNAVFKSSMVDQYVEIIVLSNEMGLKKTFYWGRVWLCIVFQELDGNPLRKHHLSNLIPTMKRDGALRDFSEVLPADCWWDFEKVSVYLNGEGEELGLGLEEKMLAVFSNYRLRDSLDITDPLTLDVLTLGKEAANTRRFLLQNLLGITVTLHEADFDTDFGTFDWSPSFNYRSENNSVWFRREANPDWKLTKRDQWEIVLEGQTFFCKGSEYEFLPPKEGWFDALSPEEQVDLELGYVWR